MILLVNKELLEKKIKLQKVKNILKELNGVAVIQIYDEISKYDSILNRLLEAGYYSDEKQPDSNISADSDESVIYQWIIDCMELRENQKLFLVVNHILVKMQIVNSFEVAESLWNHVHPDSKGITILNEQMTILWEVGNDSRDEQNYLFDKYYLC